jgi:hypothetical protein
MGFARHPSHAGDLGHRPRRDEHRRWVGRVVGVGQHAAHRGHVAHPRAGHDGKRRGQAGPAGRHVRVQLHAPVGDHRTHGQVPCSVSLAVSSRSRAAARSTRRLSTSRLRSQGPRRTCPPATTGASGRSARSRSASATVVGMCQVTTLLSDGGWVVGLSCWGGMAEFGQRVVTGRDCSMYSPVSSKAHSMSWGEPFSSARCRPSLTSWASSGSRRGPAGHHNSRTSSDRPLRSRE